MKYQKTISAALPYAFALLLVALATWFISDRLRSQTETMLIGTLNSVADYTHTSLREWRSHHTVNARSLASMPTVQQATLNLQKRQLDGSLDFTSRAQEELRDSLSFSVSNLGYLGYFLIDPKGQTLTSMRESNSTGFNTIASNAPEVFRAALTGDSGVTLPFQSDVPIVNAIGELSTTAATMFVLAPVLDRKGDVLAVLALRINPYLEFSSIFAQGRSGLSGETYAFNKEGVLISESRFDDELIDAGLLSRGQSSSLNIQIRDPGRDLRSAPAAGDVTSWPLTRMARSAVSGESGSDLKPYRDYRGVPVIGTWRWDDTVSLGFATEIDAEEAYAQLNSGLTVIQIFAGAIGALIITLGLLQERSRRQSSIQEAALLQAKEKAEQANRAKMEFLSGMSHDLRTPLNAVIGFSQLMTIDENIQKNARHREQLGYIERSGELLLKMLNEILDFATVDIGETNYELAAVKPLSLIQDCVSMNGRDAKKRDIHIKVSDNLADLPDLLTDPTRATQILNNLLSNAVKYNKEGGNVSIEATQENDSIRIMVADTGPGIAAEKLDDLWEPFKRLGAENTAIQGTGIGLAFSKALVQGLGGQIGATSTPGIGSQFWFSFPIATGEERHPEPEAELAATTDPADRLKHKHVLYVEDVEINQLIMKNMLKQIEGLVLVCADTGEEGLRALQEGHFDILLVDIQLPDMNGFDWNQKRSDMGLAERAAVIAVSADVTPESHEKARQEGLFGYIEKPVKLDTLLTTLAAAVQNRRH